MAAGGGTKAIMAAMLANAGIAIAKFIAFLVTGSASMLAESIHSVADTSNQGLLLLGGKRAKRIADDQHQFGYGRERYFWAFVVALVLFTLGGVYSIYEGITKILHPHELASIGWAVAVLLIGIGLEGASFRTAVLEANKVKGDQTWWEYIKNSRAPEIPVVLLEDSGALVGLSLALAGIGMYAITGDEVWDAVGTLSIGILLCIIAVVLTIEMQSLLIGEAASDDHIRAISAAVRRTRSVKRIIDLRTQHIGPDEILVAGKVEFERSLSNPELADAIDECEAEIRAAVPIAKRIYIEPDLYDPDQANDEDPSERTVESGDNG